MGWEDPLEKRKATHSSILAWRITWVQSMGSQSPTLLSDFHFHSLPPPYPIWSVSLNSEPITWKLRHLRIPKTLAHHINKQKLEGDDLPLGGTGWGRRSHPGARGTFHKVQCTWGGLPGTDDSGARQRFPLQPRPLGPHFPVFPGGRAGERALFSRPVTWPRRPGTRA